MPSLYKCPVCGKKLSEDGNTFKCENNHCFDISKKGYVNLLTANQGNKFKEEGDKKDSINSRSRFLDSGAYSFLLDFLVSKIKSIQPKSFLDLACGEGYYTVAIHKELLNSETYGVDISKSAISHCCTRINLEKLQNISFCIGNLDYLPFLDHSFACLLNCFGPYKKEEYARVIEKDGTYIRVLPGKHHLYEFKNYLYEEVKLNEDKDLNLDGFHLISDDTINKTIDLDNQQLKDLLSMTPYSFKTKPEAIQKLFKLEKLTTVAEFRILIYKKD